jgi:isocitrate dehydrogenase
MKRITIAKGDGIGPEIMDSTLAILKAAGAELEYDEIAIGEKVYLSGNTSGISDDAWQSIRENKILLKAPITTPQGGGYKSLNVTMRKTLGLFANVRPCMTLHPFIATKHPVMDLVIVRENEEDLYAGIEHQQTDEVVQCLKLISLPGCERIIRYAFEYARQNDRKKVTCFSKDNIMKQTDGLFHKTFDRIGEEYPEIKKEHWIVDIGAAKLADTPEAFDVIVMPNLYGDILSDVAAQITGSVGLAGSANIGDHCSMFEAIHGSAPDIADKGIANPSGLINAAVMMLNHLGQNQIAEKIANAWVTTIEQGVHTADIYKEGVSKRKVSTTEFTQAVIENLGKTPSSLPVRSYPVRKPFQLPVYKRAEPGKKELVGVDLFIHWRGNANDLGEQLKTISTPNGDIILITNRGVKVWPNGFEETFCTDHWRCRFMPKEGHTMESKHIIELLSNSLHNGIDVVKTENLYNFNGKAAYSLGQGQ